MTRNYNAFSKATGEYLFSFTWWPGMAEKHETLAEYMRRRWHGNVIARPAM